jgi:hypothetical protein
MGTPGIDINYALFTSSGTVVQDGGKAYQNLFDALVDTFSYALESAGAGSVGIVVSETGWPSAGAPDATVRNAQTYNQKLINHVRNGTPKMPQQLETYIFAMFNENQKSGLETEKHFGLFNPDKSPAYLIIFNSSRPSNNGGPRKYEGIVFNMLKMLSIHLYMMYLFFL